MLSLFPRASKYTLQIRKDHIQARDSALCIPLSAAESKPSSSFASLSQLPPSEIAIQDGDLEILSCTLQELVSGIAERKWTSTRILHAFIRSARRAQQKINCITQPNFTAALKAAEERDEHFAKTGELVGPLHGIPFSFKENNNIKGLTTTVGYTAWVLDGPASSDAALAQMVQHLGGIVILKTNVPQTMMSFECSNPLYGRTLNPWSPAHTPGGSSGGEAAVLASDGAAAGFGSDIGGSLRIPTGYCGIYAIKPTIGRLPGAGTRTARHGFEGIPCVYAPMCRSTADLEFLFRELVPLIHPGLDSHIEPHEAQKKFGSEPLRPSPLRPAWFDPIKVSEARGKPLRIGYYFCDGYIKTSPACMRGVKESIEALQASADYKDGKLELVEIDPARLNTVEALHIFTSQITSDRCDGLLGPLKMRKVREAMDFALFLPVFAARGATWMTKILYWIVKYVIGDKALGYLLTAGGGKTASQYFDHVARRDQFRAAFRKKVWDFYQLDGIIW
jgi:amidase